MTANGAANANAKQSVVGTHHVSQKPGSWHTVSAAENDEGTTRDDHRRISGDRMKAADRAAEAGSVKTRVSVEQSIRSGRLRRAGLRAYAQWRLPHRRGRSRVCRLCLGLS